MSFVAPAVKVDFLQQQTIPLPYRVTMAEVIGLIATVITISQAVTEGIQRARSIYRAQEEFEELQASRSRLLPQHAGLY